MTAPSLKEVIENVTTLENDYQHFRDAAQVNGDVYALRRLPKLPKDLARSEAVYMLSPDVADETKTLSAFMLAMRTRIGVLALSDKPGVPVNDSTNKRANELEKDLALAWLQLNPNRSLEAAWIWRQLVHPVAITVMELNDWDHLGSFPFSAYDVELDGVGWQEKRGIPTAMGRHYRQRVKDIAASYAGRPQGKEDASPEYDGQRWSWSDDYSWREHPTQQSSVNNKTFAEAEMMWYDDGEYITYAAINAPKAKWQLGPVRFGNSSERDGMILWQGPNPFGRVSAFLCSGDWTPLREVRDSRRAFLDDYIVVTQQLNMIASIRATAARNRASARNYLKPEPDSYKAWMAQNKGKPMPPIVWRDGETPVVNGELMEVPGLVDPDLDKQEAALEARRQRLQASGFTKLLDPAVVKDSTLGAWLGAFDAGNQKISAPTGRRDICTREMLEAVLHATRYLHGINKNLASYDLAGHGGWLQAGSKRLKEATTGRLDYESQDFSHRIIVETRSATIAQQQQSFAMMMERAQPLPDGRPGVFIYQDMWDAIDEDDPSTRRTTMAIEGLEAEVAVPLIKEIVKSAVSFAVEQELGVRRELVSGQPGAMPPGPGMPGLPANQVVPQTPQQTPPATEPVVSNATGGV